MICVDCGEDITEGEMRVAFACTDCGGLMHLECLMLDDEGTCRCEAHHYAAGAERTRRIVEALVEAPEPLTEEEAALWAVTVAKC